MQFWSLTGLTHYEDARLLQLKLVDLRAAGVIPDTVLFLEHQPVITRGRGLQFTGAPGPRHMPLPVALSPGIAFAESERGGDLTYHGPGQLVIYPIVKLDGKGFGPDHDIGGFLRKFEQVLIGELASRGVEAKLKQEATGVWVGERKVASLGIAVRKWVVYHGMAINCVNDLKPFYLISPCGYAPEVMTRMADLESGFERSDWREKLEVKLALRMSEQSGGRSESVSSSVATLIRHWTCAQAFAEAMALDPGIILA